MLWYRKYSGEREKEGMHEKKRMWSKGGAKKNQDVAMELQELSVDTAGGQSREYHAVTNHNHQLPAEIDPLTFCYPAFTHP